MHKLLITATLIVSIAVTSARAADLSTIFPIDNPAIWTFDYDAFTVTDEEHVFGAYTALRFDQASDTEGWAYIVHNSTGMLLVGMYNLASESYVSLADYPITFFKNTMSSGESVVSNVPASVFGESGGTVTFTSTYRGLSTVNVPSGSYTAHRIEFVVDDPAGTYTEWLYLVDGTGPVLIYRDSESPSGYDGCIFTCGSLGDETGSILRRSIQGTQQYIMSTQATKVVVIPLQ